MEIVELTDKKGKERFILFRRNLYRGDGNYVSTSEFVLSDLLYERTEFSLSCNVLPVAVTEEGRILCEAVFMYNKKLPYFQVGFFEALKDVPSAVKTLLDYAKEKAKGFGADEIVIGLNAHISYGVGLLTRGFDFKNSFDSNYNKSYYESYFEGMRSASLSTYRGVKKLGEEKLLKAGSPVTVRHADMKNFEREAENMRLLCEKTISKTFMYFPTEKGHFYELMRDLKPFLKGENLLFAEDATGKAVGFLFWHPDFNQMLAGGRYYSTFGIALAWIFGRNKIDTAKLNAIGSLSVGATNGLINEFERVLGDRYKYVETNFVWDNNIPSSLLNRRLFGEPHRKYKVFFTNVTD